MTYDSEVAADSPLVYLKFDETSGTSAADSSGNSHAGTITGSPSLNQTAVMPNGTGSYQLNTTGKYVQVANGSYMNVSAWTAEAWVNLTGTSSYHAVINRDGTAGSRGWNLYVTGGKLNAFDSVSDHLGGTTLSTGTAYHVAVTFDGTTIKLYLNGVLDGSFTTAFGVTSTNPITIGTSHAGTGSPSNFSLTGTIDHVAYYGSTLSAARLLAHYNAGVATPITVAGTAFAAPSTFLDGVMPISLSGEAFASPATMVSGSALTAIRVAGDPFASPVTMLDGHVQGTPILGEAWHSSAAMLSGGAIKPVGTDTSNAFSGRQRGGSATVSLTVPVTPTPTGTTRGPRVDKAVPLPLPTLVNGRPT